jgi:hypothetical protein
VTQTYEVTLGLGSGDANGFFSDYKLSDTATTLNTDSLLVKLAGGVSGCAGMTTPNYDGTYGTYYAGAIYAAQAALVAEQAANPGSNNALIILTDGAANGSATNSGLKYKAATGTCASGSGCPIPILPSSTTGTTVNGLYADASGNYPSYKGTCGQAVVAANYAKSQGTTVFTIGYGSETTSDQCPTDVSFGSTYANITPCQAMAAMATDLSDFYTANQSGYAGTPCSNAVYCQNNVGTTSGSCTTQGTLSTIFAALVPKLTAPRLIPNGTT